MFLTKTRLRFGVIATCVGAIIIASVSVVLKTILSEYIKDRPEWRTFFEYPLGKWEDAVELPQGFFINRIYQSVNIDKTLTSSAFPGTEFSIGYTSRYLEYQDSP
jgi:hypothetical protein